jgi:uncharacterized membrane protein
MGFGDSLGIMRENALAISDKMDMNLPFELMRALSVVGFLFFGMVCLFTDQMVAEFERYRLPQLRAITGVLEVLGALGLVLGQWSQGLFIAAASGLSLLMLAGILVRTRIHDPFLMMAPALILLVMNAYLAAFAMRATGWPITSLGRS